ncbi:hypothetical protein COV61_02760 [Candidatus Micrarchaeota archaeon CG11_big_fil_rev_8_21_14_0_20_47_5]|nr:MAG: hypothetical protein AUJ17_03185 [Candidatus Micrarchaeota archaeon CG1_02_47_40]PIN83559.1 MAG: hypothetical protein COV61_02760 [Candidatus Micrarchaeota archaeon CG11_big_fil_rev_8_21_14_0_20_47_5]
MNMKETVFILVFSLAALIASQVNFSPLLGAQNQSFTFFQFFGPMAGGFLGIAGGAASVLIAQLAGFLLAGNEFSLFNALRFLPMILAAAYFARNGGKAIGKSALALSAIPILCMALFILHPIGGQVWYYSLYWLIPALMLVLFPGRLIARSLGSTFSAHAAGSVAFLYLLPSTPALWLTLIPIVAFERGLFAGGIAVSYVVANTLLEKLSAKLDLTALAIDKSYCLCNLRFL